MRTIPYYQRNQIIWTLLLLLVLPSHVAPMESSTLNQQPQNQNRQRSLQSIPNSSDGKELFETFDKDHNGMLDRQEYSSLWTKFQKDVKDKNPSSSTTATGGGGSASSSTWFQWMGMSGGSSSSSSSKTVTTTNADELKFWPAFVNSLSMIIATEIGDKTFFIAAVLSMKNDRLSVFGGAILALIVMTILSSLMGLVLPSFLPRKYTHIIGGILFLYFGIKLIYESRSLTEGKCSDELEEVEEELLQQSSKKDDAEIEDSLEAGEAAKSKVSPSSKSKSSKSNIFVQAFTMTFLAEWGDRSQIATIALAAAKNPFGVNLGGILGHSLCTGMAVVGGRMLAAKIEEKTVTKWSGIIFLGFGIHSLFFEES